MSFKEDLLYHRRRAKNSAYLLFVTRYNPKSKKHYIFCESSEDVQFYDIVLNREFSSGQFDFIPCNGKATLLWTRSVLLARKYKHSRLSFIIDRDHDGYLAQGILRAADIYVTDYYSVEGYLCEAGTFVACVRQFCSLQHGDPLLGFVSKCFVEGFDELVEGMLMPMSTAIVLRRIGGADSLHMDSVQLHQFVAIGSDLRLAICGDLSAHLMALWKGSITGKEVAKASRLSRSIAKVDARIWLRSKFVVWWFAQFFNGLARYLRANRRDMNGGEIHCGLTMGRRQFITIVSQFGGCPTTLRRFMRRRLSLA